MTNYEQVFMTTGNNSKSGSSRQFRTGLFDCAKTGNSATCLFALFCPCIVFGHNNSLLHNRSISSNTLYYLLAGFGGCSACLGAKHRTEIRLTRNIVGSEVEDCLIHSFCHPCALTQEHSELTTVKD
ncbi:PLAC8 family-domain-containing protein [Globomyces pollinis-pini]|nr:PLAC8 family-domain-containing protein [Globomyces pollinis-pini]